jgi:2'-5' RNA ligase
MRTFIACELDPVFVEQTARLSRQLHRQIDARFMRLETYHITLAFLGEVNEGEVRLAMDALDATCAEAAPISVTPCGLGRFGKPRDATLWLDFTPCPALNDLAERLRDELDSRGLSYDSKPFKAHLTLARHARLHKDTHLDGLVFPAESTIDTVTLFKSTLTQEGAHYKPLYTVKCV